MSRKLVRKPITPKIVMILNDFLLIQKEDEKKVRRSSLGSPGVIILLFIFLFHEKIKNNSVSELIWFYTFPGKIVSAIKNQSNCFQIFIL